MEHFLSIIPDSSQILHGILTGLGILCAASLLITATAVLITSGGRRG